MTTKQQKTHEPIKDLEGEVWKDVVGYEGLYEVSNKGRVKSLNYHSTNRPSLLRHDIRNDYHRVTLCKNNKTKKFFVHRLVYEAFIGDLPKYESQGEGNGDKMWCINHKDENPNNNCIENLEVLSIAENNRYGLFGQKVSEAKSMAVYQYDLDGNFVKKWKSTIECQENGFQSSKISLCCNKKRFSHKKYIWSYKKLNKKEVKEKAKIASEKMKRCFPKKVFQYTKKLELVRIWESQGECEGFGFDQPSISACCLGKLKTHNGYIWSHTPLFND